MPFFVKLILSNLVIIGCAQLGKRFPSLAGLIATMPLTTLIVLLWLYNDQPGDTRELVAYTRGVLWGIGPTICFFAMAWFCFHRGYSLSLTLGLSFTVWLAGAALHQALLH